MNHYPFTPPKFESVTGRKRLLRTHIKVDISCFDDLLYSCAVTIEDAYLKAGAVPGINYSVNDLFYSALPLALERMKSGEGSSITTGIPDDHPHAGLDMDADRKNELEAEVLDFIKAYGSATYAQVAALSAGFNGDPDLSATEALHRLIRKGKVQKRRNGDSFQYVIKRPK